MEDLDTKNKETLKVDYDEIHVEKFDLISFQIYINAIKLDCTNFVLAEKILKILKSYELEDFGLDIYLCPSKKDYVGKICVEFRYQITQDKMIRPWLITCMKDELMKDIFDYETDAKMWKTLEELFASHSREKIF